MKNIFTLLICLTLSIASFAQVKQNDYNLFQAKEFSKEISLFKAKKFLINNVLDIDNTNTQFEAIPLAAASSGELTTLFY